METLLVVALVTGSAIVVLEPVLRRMRRRGVHAPESVPSCGKSCAGCSCSFSRAETSHKIVALAILLCASPALAVDTTETFGLGATNAEYYFGYEGVGSAQGERRLSNEIVLGYGLTDRLSGYLGTCVAADQQQFRGETSLCFGLIATPRDGDHFDLDVVLDVAATGDALGSPTLAPGLELNFDHAPDMTTWGLFVRTGFAAYGSNADPTRAGVDARRLVDLTANPGAYWQVGERNQLLLEIDVTAALGAERDDPGVTHGLALGLNRVVSPTVEVLTQVRRAAAIEDQDAAWSLTVGFIATLPAGR